MKRNRSKACTIIRTNKNRRPRLFHICCDHSKYRVPSTNYAAIYSFWSKHAAWTNEKCLATKHHHVLSFATLWNCIGTQAINQDHWSFHLYLIYCISCTLCKKLYIGETGRRLGDRFREHLRDVPGHSKQHMTVCDVFLHQGSTESRKTSEQKFIFQIGTLNPNSINEHFSFNSF